MEFASKCCLMAADNSYPEAIPKGRSRTMAETLGTLQGFFHASDPSFVRCPSLSVE
jgi:hypothetical protein